MRPQISGNARASGPISGTGIGLRSRHLKQILAQKPDIPWLEILADNHMATGGVIPAELEAIRVNYPITLHCVGMNLAGTDALDLAYLACIRELIRRYEPALVSDHLCFTSNQGRHHHDLLPIPYTEEALRHVSARVRAIQDILGTRILVENVSSYLTFKNSTITEAEFLAELINAADCALLVDVNNAYVNQVNHGIDAEAFFKTMPAHRIREVHLAGFENKGDYLIDAHNNPVAPPVWELYRDVVARLPGVPTLIEWDNDVPGLDILLEQAATATQIAAEAAPTAVA